MTRFTHGTLCLAMIKLALLMGIITTGGNSVVLTSSHNTRPTGENNERHLPTRNPCPEEEDISPCVCNSHELVRNDIDCSKVSSEDELREIFNKQFPYTNFGTLIIDLNEDIRSLKEGDLGNATFRSIVLSFGALNEIDDRALMGSWDTLIQLDIQEYDLTYAPNVSKFTKLEFFDFSYSNLYQFPPLRSKTLYSIGLTNNNFIYIPLDAFQETPNLTMLDLSGNPLGVIGSGTFTKYENLAQLFLSDCSLTTIAKDAIKLYGGATSLNLNRNQLTSIPSEVLSNATLILDVSHNNLTVLPEKDYRPVLEKAVFIYIHGNPFDCGCDIAWLVENQKFMNKVCGLRQESMVPSCHNSTLFTDLDPEYYKENCHNSTEEF